MRELKFRVFRKDHNQMFDPWTIQELWVDDVIATEENIEKDVIFMQYTGLKDKNGKDIYEGDVIEYQGYPENLDYRDARLVEWVKGGFILRHLWSNDNAPHESEYMMQLWFATIPKRYIIIGNRYENPELLEEK